MKLSICRLGATFWLVASLLGFGDAGRAQSDAPRPEIPERAQAIRLLGAPDETAAVAATVRPDEIVSAVAQSLGPGGTEWYLVRARSGATGWIRAGDISATAAFRRAFQSLSKEPSADDSGNRPSAGSRRGPIAIPLDTRGSLALVRVTFNHRVTATLALDTGASKTMISRRIAEQLGLPSLGSAPVAGIGGIVSAGFARVDSVRVSDAEVSNLVVAVHDFTRSPEFEGLLGLDFLRNFDVSFDTAKQRLLLTPR